MGTKASIQFRDEHGDTLHVYRGHDGHPQNVIPDLEKLLQTAEGRWSGSEIELLVTMFLAMNWDVSKSRLPDYMITLMNSPGDRGYQYEVVYEIDAGQPGFGTRGKWVARCLR